MNVSHDLRCILNPPICFHGHLKQINVLLLFLIHVLYSCTGSARTSLIVTIGPSPRHRGETSSTILFGQRVSSHPFSLVKSSYYILLE